MLAVKKGKGDVVSADKIVMVNDLLHIVSETLLEIETYDIIGDVLVDGTFEEYLTSWAKETNE